MSEQKLIKSRILQRIDDEQNWASVNPILSSAEIVFSRTENGTFMKLGDGRHYLDTPFYQDIKIDESQISSLDFVHIAKEDYERLVATSSVNESTIYFLSGDLDAYGRRIMNVADGTDLSDAVNLRQLRSVISSEFDKLSSKAETSSLADYMKLSSDQIQGLSSTVEIRDGSSIEFESGSQVNVDTGAQINMRSGAQLNFLNSHSKAVVGDWSQISVRNSDRNLCIELGLKADFEPFSRFMQNVHGLSDISKSMEWDETEEYFLSDHVAVAYKGKYYLIEDDSPAGTVPSDENYWTEIPYHAFAQFNGFGLVETTYDALIALRNNGHLFPGCKYRITDFVTTVDQDSCRSAGHPFDLIVTALDRNTLDENATATLPSNGDNYFDAREFHIQSYAQYLEYKRVPLESWDIKYCLDNDKSRFVWADEENGKGVIYYMKDEFGNEAPYDFKNVQFKRYEITAITNWDTDKYGQHDLIGSYGLPVGNIEVDEENYEWCYTFNGIDYSEKGLSEPYDFSGWHISPTDLVLEQFQGANLRRLNECADNIVAKKVESDSYLFNSMKLPNNVFNCALNNTIDGVPSPLDELLKIGICSGNEFGINCYSNTFGNDCYSNMFGNSCDSNTFGNDCYSNMFGNSCDSNTFGNNCYSNMFGNSCDSNTFGNNCYNNTFGNECYINMFGNSCDSNTFGNSCTSNTFGYGCNSNMFGNSCDSNTFGNDCRSNTFGNSCYSNMFGNECYNNTFGNECYINTFGNSCDSNTFGNSCFYIKVGQNSSINSSNAKQYCRYIRIESGNCYIVLNPTGTTSSSQYYQNVLIKPRVNNGSPYKTITDPNVGQDFTTTYQPANSIVVEV